MVAPATSQSSERKLFDRALTTLIATLATDESRQYGTSQRELAELRRSSVEDADTVVECAESIGLLDSDAGFD